MALHHLLLILGSCICATTYGYNLTMFMNEIDQKCLHKLYNPFGGRGDMHLLGLTMESFISMVEKVERNHTDWDIYTVSKVLLKRFAFDGITFKEVGQKRIASQKNEYKIRWETIKPLVEGIGDFRETFVEEDLDEVEKCTMFFMMGHLVNNTFREGRDDEANDVPHDAQGSDGLGSSVMRVNGPIAKRPREQGVVSVKGRIGQAVAVSKILNAIVASQHDDKDFNIMDLYNLKAQEGFVERRIKPLQAVTLGDVLANGAIHQTDHNNGLRYFGPLGSWNSSICPAEFKLNERPLGTTNSVLRGAVDGLMIASGLKNLKGRAKEGEIRLSRILRMYYSNAGIPGVNGGSNRYSYCKRNEVMQLGGGAADITASATAFFIVHTFKEHAIVVDNPSEKIDRAYDQFNSAINELNDRDDDCAIVNALDEDNPICETSNHVFVVLDHSEMKTDGFTQQENVVGLLSHQLDVGIGAGSLNVFLDVRNVEELTSVSYNATNPSCAACHTTRIDQRHFNAAEEGEIAVLEGLNKTLAKFEREYDRQPGVPGKVAILFIYEDLKENDKSRLKRAATMVRNGHRDTRVLVVGKKTDLLRHMTHDNKDVFQLEDRDEDAEELTKNLAKKICEVPSVLQFNNCWRHTKERQEDQNLYEGYVSEGHVQYWAMYPEYFLKSYDIEIKFTVHDNGIINVCQARGHDNPGLSPNSKDCKKTENGHNTVSFRYQNPCHKFNVDNCPPINFAIRGLPGANGAVSRQFSCPVDDPKCRRIDQVHFTVSHTGVFCSGSEFLKASPLIVLVVALAHFFSKSS